MWQEGLDRARLIKKASAREDKIKKDRATIARAISALKKQKVIERIGGDKTGYWNILKGVDI